MAKEIGLQHGTTGKTLYMLIRRKDQQIWNGAAFEAYVTANLGTYDVPADGEQGTASAFYEFTFPGAIVVGVYSVNIYEQAGGAPAEGDSLIGALSFHWTDTVEVIPFDYLNQNVDGVKFTKLMDVLLAFFAGEHEVADLGGGLKRQDFKKQDGSTNILQVTFNENGEWTITTII